MALDGAFLSQLKYEIEQTALGARVDKIHQPSREELVMALRWKGGTGKLLFSAGANSPRIHFTQVSLENPKQAPMFCMLLRKHIGSARLVAVRQLGLDRILFLDFEAGNEFGDPVLLTLSVEIMGRHSNLILIGPDGRIIDAIKRINEEMSSVRQVLPGMVYVLPPQQNKLNLLECTPAEVTRRLQAGNEAELSKALMDALCGVSPVLCREIAHYVARGATISTLSLHDEAVSRLEFYLKGMAEQLRQHTGAPTMVIEPNGRPRDFSFLDIRQYGHALLTRPYPTCCALLDAFYSERDSMERMKVRAHDLLRLLANQADRIARKLALQRQELQACAGRDRFKTMGDLINANIYRLEKGMAYLDAENFYEENSPILRIPLDPQYPPAKNAQAYYAEYRKLDTAEKMLTTLLLQGQDEAAYIDSVFEALARATTEAELTAIREELALGGYLKQYRARYKKPERLPPQRYVSEDGFVILCGRNNLQNDQLTLRTARGCDIWFHTQKIPGAHTIVVTEGRAVPASTLTQAAIIAAYNSRAREGAQVAVDYTDIRHVKKPAGARPGLVIYDPYQTAYVTPDQALVERLRQAD